jgi:hypothetical protein
MLHMLENSVTTRLGHGLGGSAKHAIQSACYPMLVGKCAVHLQSSAVYVVGAVCMEAHFACCWCTNFISNI